MDRRKLIAICLLFLTSFTARMLFFAWRGNFRHGDAPEYVLLAKNLAEHGVLSESVAPPLLPTTRRAPLYPVWLMLLGGGGNDVAVAAAQSVLDSIVALLVFLLTETVAGRGWALAAGYFYALNPGPISTTCTVLTEPVFTFLMTSAGALLIYALRRDAPRWTAAAGAVTGLAALCRPIGFFFALAMALVLLLWRGKPRRVTHVLALLAASALVVGPWVVRCSRLAGAFVLVQSPVSINFYLASRADVIQGDAWMLFLSPKESLGRRYATSEPPPQTLALDRALFHEAWKNIRREPMPYLRSRVRWFPHLFIYSVPAFTGAPSGLGELWTTSRYGELVTGILITLVFTALPFALALRGLPRIARSTTTLVAAVAWGYTLLMHILTYTDPRYWAPIVPLLTVSAAFGAACMRQRGKA
jgi:4-amino-4-deoxy-L-arabinose transferase-like glycosyltransferase